ncbi:phage tail tube protein [Sphingomonas sp. CJ99]
MSNPNRVTGRARVKIDGSPLEVSGGVTLDPGGPMREPVNGDYSIGGFRQTTKEARLEFSVLDKGSFSATQFGAIDNATVSIEFDNGRNFVMVNAFSEGAPQLTTTDGLAKCVLMSPPAEELL